MARKRADGYWVRGQFVERGSALDIELNQSDIPSKSDLKKQSAEVQALGEALLTLRQDLYVKLNLPEKLDEAIRECKRITNFEGRRRQMQYIGKLMRQVDSEPIRAALLVQEKGSASETQALHQLEHWRDALIEKDEALDALIERYPSIDQDGLQQLRTWIRQARKDLALKQAAPHGAAAHAQAQGLAPRQSRVYREIFQFLKGLHQHTDRVDPQDENEEITDE